MENIRKIVANNATALEGTRAVDGSGNLMVLHHATNRKFDRFEKSSDMGFHFGTIGQAARRRKIMIERGETNADDPWRVISCALGIRNPVIIADDPGAWNPRWLTATFSSFLNSSDRDEIRRLATALNDRHPGSPITDRDEAILQSWFRTLKGSLSRADHDGIVYRNVFENTGKAIEWSWVAFSNEQVVRIGEAVSAHSIPALEVRTGESLSLRGVRPMREHQPRGIGRLMRKSDRKAFRKAVEEWADEIGLEWFENYPLDYQPAFGECRPTQDLRAKAGEDAGFFVAVSSVHGTVALQPFSRDERAADLMPQFQSDASEGFFDQGTAHADDDELICWRPAETIEAFSGRLRAVVADFSSAFPAVGPAGPRP